MNEEKSTPDSSRILKSAINANNMRTKNATPKFGGKSYSSEPERETARAEAQARRDAARPDDVDRYNPGFGNRGLPSTINKLPMVQHFTVRITFSCFQL